MQKKEAITAGNINHPVDYTKHLDEVFNIKHLSLVMRYFYNTRKFINETSKQESSYQTKPISTIKLAILGSLILPIMLIILYLIAPNTHHSFGIIGAIFASLFFFIIGIPISFIHLKIRLNPEDAIVKVSKEGIKWGPIHVDWREVETLEINLHLEHKFKDYIRIYYKGKNNTKRLFLWGNRIDREKFVIALSNNAPDVIIRRKCL